MVEPGAHALASLYLGQFSPSFWRWSEGGDALVWSDGTTIAFKDELEELLARVAQSGFPSLSAIAMVLAACRDGWEAAADATSSALLPQVSEPFRAAFEAQLSLARETMERIAALPADLRCGVESKAVLLETILQEAERRQSPSEAELIVTALREGVSPARPGGLVEWAPPSLFELAEDLAAVDAGTRGLDAAALRRRLRTGLDGGVLPAEVELPDSERVRKLLEELREDRELAGLARLARDLLAAVQVPRSVSSRDDVPVGGVSDVSNRGPLHRLLTSELAYDALTFTVRIATGEALYLRREAPPWRPPSGRVVLLDTGIRMWGVSRVYATAVGLALVGSAGAGDVVVYRWEDGELVRCDLTTREGLAEHLEAMAFAPQPGRALAQLLERVGDDDEADVVLVTHRDALTDPAFRKALAALPSQLVYVASVDADGGYQLESRSPRGRKVLGRASLDLGALLDHGAPRSQPRGPLRGAGGRCLPSILSVEPFPFLLWARLDPSHVVTHPSRGVLAVTRDGRLLHWTEARSRVGGRQLTCRVPEGSLHLFEIDDEGHARVLIYREKTERLTLITVDLDSGRTRRAQVEQVPRSLLCVVRVGGVFALIHPRRVAAVSVAGAPIAEALRLPGAMNWARGRFFSASTRGGREWQALAWDGAELILEPVPVREPVSTLELWDRHGVDGPWALARDGAVYTLASDDPPAPSRGGGVSLHGISRDGHRLVIEDGHGALFLLDLESRHSRRIREAQLPHALQEEPAHLAALAPQLRRRFHSVGLDARGRLALISRRGKIVPIRVAPDGCLVLGPGEAASGRLSFLKPFVVVDSPPQARYALRVARWPGGGQAFLDSRGLLHLVPAVGAELSLVLCDRGPLATWSTDGDVRGPAYFLRHELGDPEAAAELLQSFVASVG